VSMPHSEEGAPVDHAARTAPHVDLLVEFVNTYDVDRREDDLSDGDALRDWLSGRGLLSEAARATDDDVVRARELREGLRAVLLGHHDGAAADDVPDRLDRVTAGLPLRLSFAVDPPRLVPAADGVGGALAALVAAAAAAVADGTWARLKICSAETCRYAYFDESRNRSRTWCSMQVCGNRTKTRTYRARRRTAGDAS
jgi:predicted RNA-binding Zn ribbon-like protein